MRGKQKHNIRTLKAAAAVRGTSSIGRFFLLVDRVACYLLYRVLLVFVNIIPTTDGMRLGVQSKRISSLQDELQWEIHQTNDTKANTKTNKNKQTRNNEHLEKHMRRRPSQI